MPYEKDWVPEPETCAKAIYAQKKHSGDTEAQRKKRIKMIEFVMRERRPFSGPECQLG